MTSPHQYLVTLSSGKEKTQLCINQSSVMSLGRLQCIETECITKRTK